MSQEYDFIVIGAGPAGSTAAKLAADAGYSVLLVDKARFPRHKTCASWINRLVFERFPYLEPQRERLVESAFWGAAFLDQKLEREARWSERRPSGYLSLRGKFDNGLKDIAVAAGAVTKGKPIVRGLVVLVGDAAGFVSGSTGEGIYPAMESARLAVELADRGLRTGNVAHHLEGFQTTWRARLGTYLRDLPGGEQRGQTMNRIEWIFRSRLVCGVAARMFLYGEPISLGTLARAVVA